MRNRSETIYANNEEEYKYVRHYLLLANEEERKRG